MSADVQPEETVQVQQEEAPQEAPKRRGRPPKAKPEEQEAPTPQAPTVGRIVHYRNTGGAVRAALVIAVHSEDLVDLVVFNHLGAFPMEEVEFSADDAPETWNWPPRN